MHAYIFILFDHHFTGEVFTIVEKKLRAQIPVYKFRDFSGELLKGLFYEQEIQKIIFDPEAIFKIEKLVKTRKRKGKTTSRLMVEVAFQIQ